MAAVEDFKYSADAARVQARYMETGKETVHSGKVKLYFIYESLPFRIMLRFGKGIVDPTKNITAVFKWNAANVDRLGILSTFPPQGSNQWQEVTWYCHTPLISNYSKRLDPIWSEHEFTKHLQRPGEKKIKLTVPLYKTFHLYE